MANAVTLTLPLPTAASTGWSEPSGVSGGVTFVMPALQVSGLATLGSETATAELILPGLALQITGGAEAGSVALRLPTPTLAISGEQAFIEGATLTLPAFTIAIEGMQGNGGEVALTLPRLALQASICDLPVVMTLPMPELSAAGVTGIVCRVALTLPDLVVSASGLTGRVANVDMALPAPTLATAGYQSILGSVILPLPTFELATEGTSGNAAGVALALPTPALVSSGHVEYVGQVALQLLPQVQIVGATGHAAGIALTLRGLALAAAGHTGTVGYATMTLPILAVGAGGYTDAIGSVALALPMLVLHSTGARSVGATFSTVAMHTENLALTTYTNYEFNSFAKFNGVYLGAKTDGIFALSGATDAGVLIDAAARLGITDFSTSHLKRVERCYVGYRTDGSMVLRVLTDGGESRDYLLTATGQSGAHGNYVRIGRGVEARYWQFELLNRDGADFQLDMMEFKPTVLRRRAG